MKFVATVDGRAHTVDVTGGNGRYRLAIVRDGQGASPESPGEIWEVDARLTAQGIYSLLVGGVSHVADVSDHEGACVVEVSGETYVIDVEEQTRHIIRTRGGAASAAGGQTLKAPMPGKITHVAVRVGDPVAAGVPLVVIEAMKMENELRSGAAGTVTEVRVVAGQAVNAGDVLVVIGGAT